MLYTIYTKRWKKSNKMQQLLKTVAPCLVLIRSLAKNEKLSTSLCYICTITYRTIKSNKKIAPVLASAILREYSLKGKSIFMLYIYYNNYHSENQQENSTSYPD